MVMNDLWYDSDFQENANSIYKLLLSFMSLMHQSLFVICFAHPILISSCSSRDCVNAKLEKWWGFRTKQFKISRTKIEYMEWHVNRHIQRAETTVRIETHEIQQRDSFYYLSLIISKDGEIDKYIEHRIKTGWLKWRFAFGLLCD